MLGNFFVFLLDLIFPRFCCSCGSVGNLLCKKCLANLDFFAQPVYLKIEPLYLDELWAATEYAPIISSVIRTMKYSSVIAVCEFCAQLIYRCVDIPKTDVISFVPIHPSRLKERGFNQSAQMAKALAALTKIPFAPLLQRTQNTPNQASISDRAVRLQNLQTSFALKKHKPLSLPKSVLLIDDVATTGTTLNECAKILKENGVLRVIGVVVAHGG